MSQSLLGTRSFPLSFIFISVTRRRSLPFCLTTRSLLPSLSLSRSTRIGLRRTSIARGSELSSEIAIRMDFFSVVTFFPLIFLSFLSTPACHPPAGNILDSISLSLSLPYFYSLNLFEKITCWDREISWLQRRSHQGHLAPYTLLHHSQNFVGLHLYPLKPPSLTPPTHPPSPTWTDSSIVSRNLERFRSRHTLATQTSQRCLRFSLDLLLLLLLSFFFFTNDRWFEVGNSRPST